MNARSFRRLSLYIFQFLFNVLKISAIYLQLVFVLLSVSTPDPKFEISCPKVGTESVKSFKTRNIKDHVTTGEINEEFKFVIPHDFPSTEEFPINVSLFTYISCYFVILKIAKDFIFAKKEQ